MRVTRRRLRRIIHEAMPPGGVPDVVGAVTGVYGEEQRQLLNDLGGMYSDMHKELYKRRPRGPMFKTVEEAEAAVEDLWGRYEEQNRSREVQEKEDLEFEEMERRMQELMPGEYDIELPMQSGMGRRLENRMRITRRQLRRIIKEEKAKILREQFGDESSMLSRPGETPQHYFPDLDRSHEYEGVSGTSFSQETLDDMQQAIDYFRDRGSEEDAVNLEEILAMAVKELASGAEYPSDALFNRVDSETDTVVVEEIPHELMQWTTSWDDSGEY